MPKITITRTKGFADALRAYNIILDGNSLGKIRAGKTLSFDVSDGSHMIAVKIDWASSEILQFRIQNNETVSFECGNNTTFWNVLFKAISQPETYLWINQTS